MIKYTEKFLDKIKKLLLYLVRFSKNGSIISKEYPENCIMGGLNMWLVIIITHNESMFLANDGQKKEWTLDGHGILRLKGRRKCIMISNFLLFWSKLNFFSLLLEKQQELAIQGIPLEVMVYFKYGKTDDRY